MYHIGEDEDLVEEEARFKERYLALLPEERGGEGWILVNSWTQL